MSSTTTFDKVQASSVSDQMIAEAAQLFSSAYGVWGPLAAEKMNKFCKPGMLSSPHSFSLRIQLLMLI
jgi:hypothetical protein